MGRNGQILDRTSGDRHSGTGDRHSCPITQDVRVIGQSQPPVLPNQDVAPRDAALKKPPSREIPNLTFRKLAPGKAGPLGILQVQASAGRALRLRRNPVQEGLPKNRVNRGPVSQENDAPLGALTQPRLSEETQGTETHSPESGPSAHNA